MPDAERSGRFGCQTEIVHLHIHSHQAAGVLVREGERGNDPKPRGISSYRIHQTLAICKVDGHISRRPHHRLKHLVLYDDKDFLCIGRLGNRTGSESHQSQGGWMNR